jgi:hypothetical protein
MKIPLALGDLTAGWLSEALALTYPGAAVTSLTIGTVINGTATKVRLLLEDMLGRNARFGHATRPASPRLSASVLSQLAGCTALSGNSHCWPGA